MTASTTWSASWTLADADYGDEIRICVSPSDNTKLDVMIQDNVADTEATILLRKVEAVGLRDALTHFIENMP